MLLLCGIIIAYKEQEQKDRNKVKGNLKFGSQRLGLTAVRNQSCACHDISNIIPFLKWVILKTAEIVDLAILFVFCFLFSQLIIEPKKTISQTVFLTRDYYS